MRSKSSMRFNLFRKLSASDGSPLQPEEAKKLILRGEAPANLRVSGCLELSNNPNLEKLPEGLTVEDLDVSGCKSLCSLPDSLRVKKFLNLSGCKSLTAL